MLLGGTVGASEKAPFMGEALSGVQAIQGYVRGNGHLPLKSRLCFEWNRNYFFFPSPAPCQEIISFLLSAVCVASPKLRHVANAYMGKAGCFAFLLPSDPLETCTGDLSGNHFS